MTPGRLGPREIDPAGGPEYREPSEEEADQLMANDRATKSKILMRPVDDAEFYDDEKMTAFLVMKYHPEMTSEQIQARLRATRAAFEG